MQLTIKQLVNISPCEYAEGLPREQFIDPAIKQMWSPMPRIAGPAFTVKCAKNDHLSLHAAIYQAKAGDVLVVEADPDYATTGGNVCAIAQKRGITAMIIDGTVRDIGEICDMRFPVYALGVMPKPAEKRQLYPFNQAIQCGGVTVNGGDFIIADEDGIAVIPKAQLDHVYGLAKARADKDASMSLDEWEVQHAKKVESIIQKLGYSG